MAATAAARAQADRAPGSGGSGSGGSGGSSGGSTRPSSGSTTTSSSPSGSGRGGVSPGARQEARIRGHPRSAPVRLPYTNQIVRRPNGTPTPSAPGFTFTPSSPLGLGVPNVFIDRFRIPPFLLPIYQAAGTEYGIPWQVLAGINEIETDYGRNLNISSAGAVGWMQFLPSTFKQWAVDANGDGKKDPFNPVDAIFTAARYLKAAGGDKDIKRGIFAYNHADWYVNSVLLRAKLIGGLPADLVSSLTGLTQGRFPVAAKSTYASEISLKKDPRRGKAGNPANLVEASKARKQIRIFAKKGSPAIATQDAKVVKLGTEKGLGKYVVIEDVYGNRYTYGNLASIAKYHAVPRPSTSAKKSTAESERPKKDPKPTQAATAGHQTAAPASPRTAKRRLRAHPAAEPALTKERLFANPSRTNHGGQATPAATGPTFGKSMLALLGLHRKDIVLRPMKKGSKVVAGTVLGRVGPGPGTEASHLLFRIRPAGRGAPRIDPKPILDGWKLLEQTAIYRAAGKNPLTGGGASIGQILLMSKEDLQRRVLGDSRVSIYPCGRQDIRTGAIDRRVLATLEFLAASGFKPTVTALKCGHGYLTASGNVSEHSSGSAVDIGAINGINIIGHQGKGSITDIVVRRLLTLQGTMKPHQIITLMSYPGTDNTLALPDHYNHIHVGFRPGVGQSTKLGKQVDAILKPGQWLDLVNRLNEIQNPKLRLGPQKYVIEVKKAKHRKGGD